MSEKIYGQFDLETIEKLADIVNSKELGEIKICDGDKKIVIKGKMMPPPPHRGGNCPPPPPPFERGGFPPQGFPPQGAFPQGVPADKAEKSEGKAIKAPIVGTFYAAPAPDEKPFVSVGQTVHKGDTVFIIESMKVMSEVQSDIDGVVKEILVNDGDSVEYDQAVIVLE